MTISDKKYTSLSHSPKHQPLTIQKLSPNTLKHLNKLGIDIGSIIYRVGTSIDSNTLLLAHDNILFYLSKVECNNIEVCYE